jgi:hypothetical protein
MTPRFPSPFIIGRLSDAGLREQLAQARTLLMYGHTPVLREETMVAIERITAELRARGVAV